MPAVPRRGSLAASGDLRWRRCERRHRRVLAWLPPCAAGLRCRCVPHPAAGAEEPTSRAIETGGPRNAVVSAVPLHFVASSPRGFGDLLARELQALGAADVRERALGVEFAGTLETAYRACLESRVASRVFLEVRRFEAHTDEEFYAAIRAIDWRPHVDPRRTLACDFS